VKGKSTPLPPSIFSNLADYFRVSAVENVGIPLNILRINNFQTYSARISALVDAVEID
jgi:hypothetical protein